MEEMLFGIKREFFHLKLRTSELRISNVVFCPTGTRFASMTGWGRVGRDISPTCKKFA